MNPVRYGVIGAGVIANYMTRAFTEGRGSIATVVADINPAAAQKVATASGAPKVVTDWRTVIADPAVDAVYLATPPFLHQPMTIAALQAGKHVCCEKPFMLTQAEVRDVIAAQKGTGLHVNCASSRYNSAGTAQKAKQMIATGELGRLYHVAYTQVNPPTKPGATLPDWRNDPARNGGGISFDWGPYDLDWLSFVLGDLFRPQLVFGTLGNYFPLTAERVPPCLDVDGRYTAQIICEDGLTILWERRAGEHGPARHSIELRGTKGGLDTYFMPMPEKSGMQHHAYVGTEELKTTLLPDAPPSWDDAIINPIRELTAAIRENRPLTNTPAENLRIHGVLDALHASGRTRQAVKVAE